MVGCQVAARLFTRRKAAMLAAVQGGDAAVRPSKKAFDRSNHFIELRLGELGVNGDAEDFGGEAVGDFAVAAAGVGQGGEAFLLVHGERVVNLATDSFCYQVRFECLALSCTDDAEGVLIPNVIIVRIRHGEDNFCRGFREPFALTSRTLAMGGISDDNTRKFCEMLGVVGGVVLTPAGVGIVLLELYPQQRGLESIHAEVATDHGVEIFRLHAVVSHHACFLSEGVVVGDEQSAITKAAETEVRRMLVALNRGQKLPGLVGN